MRWDYENEAEPGEGYAEFIARKKAELASTRLLITLFNAPSSKSSRNEYKGAKIINKEFSAPGKNSVLLSGMASDTSCFTYGLLTLSSKGPQSRISGVHIKKTFSILGKSYNFLMNERVPVHDDSNGSYSYNFRMYKDKRTDFLNFKKRDLRKMECGIWFYDNNNVKILNPDWKVTLSLTFSDSSKLSLSGKQLKIY